MAVTYPYLPQGRTILYVPLSDPAMAAAAAAARNYSTETNHPTGAVVVRQGQVLGWGANQAAINNRWLATIHKNYFCVRRFFHVPSGQKYWLCPGCAQYRHHAEQRAVRDAVAKHPHEVAGADLYLWGHWWCCQPCWGAMIFAGINNVYLLTGSEILFNGTKSKN